MPSWPAHKNVNFKPRIDSTEGRPVGTSTNPWERMAPPVRAVLALPSVPVEDAGRDFFALPDRSTIAIARRQSAVRSVDAAFGTTMFCHWVLHRSW